MTAPSAFWPAIAQATLRRVPRVPFFINGIEVGSVARAHLDTLRALSAFDRLLQITDERVALVAAAPARDATLSDINTALRAQGLIRAWRDETYPVVNPRDPLGQPVLACIERAASRFWGTLTFGAHCTGWVAGSDGLASRLWVAQRSFSKATDPGAFDNLVGGGVPQGQTPFDTLVREGWEEAGLTPEVMRRALPGRVIQLLRDIPDGLQFEWIHAFDLQLHDHDLPVNQDGEVQAFSLLAVADALAIAAGNDMTADAALVTLDFALRHRLFDAATQQALAERAQALWVQGPA
jgi:8-oxo-dGTP pyrophosphatase MutT (NUDIX family)